MFNDFIAQEYLLFILWQNVFLSIKDLDKRLKAGDIKLVRELGNVKIGDDKRYFYSFATKIL